MKERQGKLSMKERQRQLREATILDAARELLSTKGFTAMTLDDVITEVGISKPTFYQHFASKEALGVSVLLRAIREAHDHLKALEASLPPDEAFRAMIDWAIDKHYGPGSYYDFAGVLSLFAHESLRVADRELVKALAALVARGQQEGSVKTSAPPVLVAQTLHSILKDSAYEDELARGQLDLPAMKSGVAKLLLG
jgi:AcrR family transcriptional regulator